MFKRFRRQPESLRTDLGQDTRLGRIVEILSNVAVAGVCESVVESRGPDTHGPSRAARWVSRLRGRFSLGPYPLARPLVLLQRSRQPLLQLRENCRARFQPSLDTPLTMKVVTGRNVHRTSTTVSRPRQCELLSALWVIPRKRTSGKKSGTVPSAISQLGLAGAQANCVRFFVSEGTFARLLFVAPVGGGGCG